MPHWTDVFVKMDACSEAIEWAEGYNSLDAAWAACERADWMLWWLSRNIELNAPEHRRLVACVCECARTSRPYAGEWTDRLSRIYADRASADPAWASADAIVAIASAARASAHAAMCAIVRRHYPSPSKGTLPPPERVPGIGRKEMNHDLR